jgi:hypothetical protein
MPTPQITITTITVESSSSLDSGVATVLQSFPTDSITAPAELHATLDDIWSRITGHQSDGGPVQSPPAGVVSRSK